MDRIAILDNPYTDEKRENPYLLHYYSWRISSAAWHCSWVIYFGKLWTNPTRLKLHAVKISEISVDRSGYSNCQQLSTSPLSPAETFLIWMAILVAIRHAGQVASPTTIISCMLIEGSVGRIVIVLSLDLHNCLSRGTYARPSVERYYLNLCGYLIALWQ